MFPFLVLLQLHPPVSLTQAVTDPPPGCGVYHQNFTIPPAWDKLFSAGRDLIGIYKNPSSGSGHQVVRAAMIYLEELEELEKAVDENRPKIMDVVWELYICGGPLHLRQIPYAQFIELYKWDAEDVDEYFTFIDDTRRVWNNLLEELERVADRDIII